jgi:alginate O-acetyltransferase complex protein AlgI
MIGKPLSIIITFIITLVGWVIFRAETFPQAMSYIATMFDFGNMDLAISTTRGTYDWFIEQRFLIIFGVASFFSFLPGIKIIEKNMNPFFGTQGEKDFIFLKSILAIVLLYICMTEVISTGVNPFIYYRF